MKKTLLSLLIIVLLLLPACLHRRGSIAEAVSETSLNQFDYPGGQGSYYLHLPRVGAKGRSVVLAFHGGEGNGASMEQQTGLSGWADKEDFVVVYPNAPAGHWNDGRLTTDSGSSDVEFVRALISHLEQTHDIDTGRVYAVGMSNGGMFTYRLACEATHDIAGFATVVANLPQDFAPRCRPAGAVPMLMINGTEDRLMPWQGGEIGSSRLLGLGKGGAVISTPETFQFWAENNGCMGRPRLESLPDYHNDGTTVTRVTHDRCLSGEAVKLYRVNGGGHTWPGAYSEPPLRIVGRTSREIDATRTVLQHFGLVDVVRHR